MNNIISLSGGKDSTAMLHMMIERGEKIHSVVFFDTGWEFPSMYDHIKLIEQKTGLKVWVLHPRLPFDYLMHHKPVKSRTVLETELEQIKIERKRIGWGWPSPMRRWCTREKVSQIEHFSKDIENGVQVIGFAADEAHRAKDNTKTVKRYPLIEYDITEKQALKYCFDLGYTWGGLYEHYSRVSCYCCPLQKIGDLRKLRKFYPDLWAEMLKKDKLQPDYVPGFKDDKSVHHFEKRFAMEEKQMEIDFK